jgi:hypothetical protein
MPAFSSSPESAAESHGAAGGAAAKAEAGVPTRAPESIDTALRFSIQFWDQKIYYQGDDVWIKATIANGTPNVYRFRLADNRMFSIDFDIRDLGNQAIRPSETFTAVLAENKPVFARDVTILPGEDFSFVERLNNYRHLGSGVFMVSASFMPELRGQSHQAVLQSNRLSLSVRPDVRRQYAAEERVEEHIQQTLRAANLPPDQAVAYMLSARQTNQREKYFLYLDLEGLYRDEPRRSESYRRLGEAERLVILRAFSDELWKTDLNSAISFIPTSWEIMNTSYAGDRGTVIVLQKYKNNFFTEVKEFKYQLRRQNDIWKIASYSVTNKGNEKPIPAY